jgi:L-fuculokinase
MSYILIFDIGKTNKKAFVFDEGYRIVYQAGENLEETADEDGFPCEDIRLLVAWIREVYSEVQKQYKLRAINFCTYGASLVFLDGNAKVITPLYNYLKPYPKELQEQFYAKYGLEVAATTASPVLGSLNSGLLAYRLKQERPEVFAYVKRILHLPNYLSSLFSGKFLTDITSVGCHTKLWDFSALDYHSWVKEEGITRYFPKIQSTLEPVVREDGIAIGTGLHDSSSALIPYLKTFKQPFVLISTGTWNITFNPFHTAVLTEAELDNDCLCYLRIDGKPIKASRLLAGIYHDEEVEKIAQLFEVERSEILATKYDARFQAEDLDLHDYVVQNPIKRRSRNWLEFIRYQDAYHQLVADIVALQVKSSGLVMGEESKVFVDGGFGKNPIFMGMLRRRLIGREVWTAEVPQASAIGAALVIHSAWNSGPIPEHFITLTQG